MEKQFAFIDGNSLMYRAFYSMPPMSNQQGDFTNAIFGFLNMLLKAIDDLHLTHIAVAFDVHGPTFRHEKFQEYKAQRKPTPDELRPQFPLLKEVLRAMNICVIGLPGFEADDIIGNLSQQAESAHIPAFVITGDKDQLQLIGESVNVVITKKGLSDTEIYDEPYLMEKYGLVPSQIPDLKGLMGDASDNIPGISGIGEKTALKLLSEYHSVEKLLENTNQLKGKQKEKIEAGHEIALFSKEMATIDRDAPIGITLDEISEFELASQEAQVLLGNLQLNQLLTRIRRIHGTAPVQQKAATISTLQELQDLCASWDPETPVSFFLGEHFTIAGENAIYDVPLLKSLLEDGVDLQDVYTVMKPLLESSIPKILHDAKSWLHTLGRMDIHMNGIFFDTSIAAWLLDPGMGQYDLDRVLQKFMAQPMGNCPAGSIMALYPVLDAQLDKSNLSKLFRELEMPLIRVLYDMETEGFPVDKHCLSELGKVFKERLSQLTEEIYGYSGNSFNINSPKQLSVVLFDQLSLPVAKKTKSGPSTNIEVLESLQDSHPIIPCIIEYRQLSKLVGTYVDGMIPLIKSQDGRLHTQFVQTGTSTGRLSSTDPNLQNIPVRMEEGRLIRKAFIPSSDEHMLVDADYSQIELRILAHMAQDQNMISAFLSGDDIHRRTASQVFDTDFEEVTPAMRSAAKAVNFGIIYGISDFGLSKQLGISRQQAGEYIRRYLTTFGQVKDFMEATIAFGRENGYVETLFGRRRNTGDLNSSNFTQRSGAERMAMNAPIQGTAADIIKFAMLRVHDRIIQQGLQSHLLLQVHDELIIDAPKSEIEAVKVLLEECMTGIIELCVPMEIDIHVADSWYDAK